MNIFSSKITKRSVFTRYLYIDKSQYIFTFTYPLELQEIGLQLSSDGRELRKLFMNQIDSFMEILKDKFYKYRKGKEFIYFFFIDKLYASDVPIRAYCWCNFNLIMGRIDMLELTESWSKIICNNPQKYKFSGSLKGKLYSDLVIEEEFRKFSELVFKYPEDEELYGCSKEIGKQIDFFNLGVKKKK